MSTRAYISTTDDNGTTAGVYHHWDGYPSGLGRTIYRAYQGHFRRDMDRLRAYLLAHTWSSVVNADFAHYPGYVNRSDLVQGIGLRPQCYCHGDRSEPWETIDPQEAIDSGCEWRYELRDDSTMVVYRVVGSTWHIVGEVCLNGPCPEPRWDRIAYAKEAV